LLSAVQTTTKDRKGKGHKPASYGDPPVDREVALASSSQQPYMPPPSSLQPAWFGESSVSTNLEACWIAALSETHEELLRPAVGAYILDESHATRAHAVATPVDHNVADDHDNRSAWSFHASQSIAPPSYRT
jgi:hypothetical protein